MAKYIQMSEDATFELSRVFKTACCDCGLVHKWTFSETKEGKFIYRIKVDKKATAQIRRKIKCST